MIELVTWVIKFGLFIVCVIAIGWFLTAVILNVISAIVSMIEATRKFFNPGKE